MRNSLLAAAAAIICLQSMTALPGAAHAASSLLTIELDPKSNTGLHKKSGWTNLPMPLLRGKAPAGAKVDVVTGKSVICRTKASKAGSWKCRVGPLKDRFYTLNAISEDIVSKSIQVLVDTKPPKPPTFYPFFAKSFISPDGKLKIYVAETGRLSLEGVASECGEVIVSEGPKAIGRVDSNCGRWGKDVKLRAGLHDLRAVLVDAAGNPSVPIAARLFVAGPVAERSLADIGGANGVQFFSSQTPRGAQLSLASAGDVNGDGTSDIVLGENGFILEVTSNWAARAYIVFGSSKRSKAPVDIASLREGRAVELVTGKRPYNSGLSVAGAGDVNGDGFGDVIIGWPAGSPLGREDAGSAYVVFGGKNLPRTIDLDALDGSDGFKIAGPAAGSRLAGAVVGAGDMNGDGFSDVAIVSRHADEKPVRLDNGVTVVFGRRDGFPAVLDIAKLGTDDGIQVTGLLASSDAAPTLTAGDFNGDGYSDVAAGYQFTGEDRDGVYGARGRILILLGGAVGRLKSGSVDTPADGINALTIDGRSGGAELRANLGKAVSAGDFNGDGVDDLAACGRGCTNVFVIYGGKTFRRGSLDIGALKDKQGFAYASLLGDARASMSAVGDVNADGRADIAVSDFEEAGEIQLAFGKRKMKLPVWPIAPDSDEAGMLFKGSRGDAAGTTLSSAGDFNADGIDDFIVGTSYVYPTKRVPRAIVVYGSRRK